MSNPTPATQLAAPYLDRLAAPTPTPGGGSASAVVAATGVALLEMVANLSLRNANDEQAEILRELLAHLREGHARLLALGADDERAYGRFRDALALPRTAAEEKATRHAALERAAIDSAYVPLDLAEEAGRQIQHIPALASVSSPYIRADLAVAAHLLAGAIGGAIAMIDTNLPSIKDESTLLDLKSRRDAAETALPNAVRTALASLT